MDIILKWTRVLGILIPVLLGGIVTSYYTDSQIMKLALFITAPLALIQLGLSTVLTVLGSDGQLSSYSRKSVEYNLLNSEFEHLGKFPDDNYESYSKKYEILLERERGVSKDNSNIKDKELRMGMRYALRNYRRACAGCGQTPVSMKPTNCEVCGNF